MTKEQVDKLFEEYSRFNAEANRTTEGTGLGMSITRSLLNMMNGEIAIESEVNKGSVFTVSIPQKKVNGHILGKDTAQSLQRFQLNDAETSFDVDISSEDFGGYKVLLADDVEINREIVAALLEPTGLVVDTAENGVKAVKMFEANPDRYDVILMDMQMPEMDGYEATKKIRALDDPKAKNIPIVADAGSKRIGSRP